MSRQQMKLIIAVLIPILLLLVIFVKNHYELLFGEKVTFSIQGFDPRDLLAGNYLSYRVDYKVPAMCGPHPPDLLRPPQAYACLEPRFFSYDKPKLKQCRLFIKGKCRYGRFYAGIERFYLPEESAVALDKYVRIYKSKIVVSVTRSGSAVIKELLVDEKPWQQFLDEQKAVKNP